MIKVMLVDDEPIEREGLRLMLTKNRNNFDIVAEAPNGERAVEQALTHKPDLIFMDIKMPRLDGLEAIKRILDSLPNTKCIMVSAYDTFDYARQAMKYGIKEYLLKPSKPSEVVEAFDRMVDEIEVQRQSEREKASIDHRLERVGSVIEMEFIVSLMMDHVHEFSLDDWKEWFELDGKQGFVTVFSFESTHGQPSREEKSNWYRMLKQTLNEQEFQCLMGPLTGFQVPVFVLVDERQEVSLEKRRAFARSIIHHVQNQVTDCRLFVGVGTVVTDVNQFSLSYQEAIYALELVHNHPSASYMAYNEQLEQKRKELIPFEVEKELVEAVKQGDLQKGLQMFDSYFQLIHKASGRQVDMLRKAMENFFIILTRTLKELGFDEDYQIRFENFDTSMQIKEESKAHVSLIAKRIKEWRTSGVHGLLAQAKTYIDNHYHRAISLEEVADEVGLSSYYLSKLFKDRFQVTFIEYLTETRLNKAKDLLRDETIPLKEIALNIGYKDPNYFSRVFKKETGQSPRQYRVDYQQ